MKSLLLESYLFDKGILVSGRAASTEEAFSTYFSLANLFGVKITKGFELLNSGLIKELSERLGEVVPAPFYTGFPESVKKLTKDELLYDQLLHYATTYGLGDFSTPGHSEFEETVDRMAFRESGVEKRFEVVTEEEALDILKTCVDELLNSTRPLNETQMKLVWYFVTEMGYVVTSCASKNTLIRLLLTTRNIELAKFLKMSDVIKFVAQLNYENYANKNIKKLNLENQDRKFITKLINYIAEHSDIDLEQCFRKMDVWCGLLHHIHYKPTIFTSQFVTAMRLGINWSTNAFFERCMSKNRPCHAADYLKKAGLDSELLRHLTYILSRCHDRDEIEHVLGLIDARTGSPIALLQLYYDYWSKIGADDSLRLPRTFIFNRFNMSVTHEETTEETKKRQSYISGETAAIVCEKLGATIRDHYLAMSPYKNLKIHVDPGMFKIALPISECTSSSGFGILPKGSIVKIPEGKKIRVFTYWEEVDDIDLSCFGIANDGGVQEFSWRSMYARQNTGVTFSGDETSGYNGGSEYFDFELDRFKNYYPGYRYIVFCNNVYTRGKTFASCLCTAGFMMRDSIDSGDIFKPKTVATSFAINTNSSMACLFAIDVEERNMIWLNVGFDISLSVAGERSGIITGFLNKYFRATEWMSVGSFYSLMGGNIVSDPEEADLIISDNYTGDKDCVKSTDVERIMRDMNR